MGIPLGVQGAPLAKAAIGSVQALIAYLAVHTATPGLLQSGAPLTRAT